MDDDSTDDGDEDDDASLGKSAQMIAKAAGAAAGGFLDQIDEAASEVMGADRTLGHVRKTQEYGSTSQVRVTDPVVGRARARVEVLKENPDRYDDYVALRRQQTNSASVKKSFANDRVAALMPRINALVQAEMQRTKTTRQQALMIVLRDPNLAADYRRARGVPSLPPADQQHDLQGAVRLR